MTAVEYLIKEFRNILGKIQTKTLQDSVFLIDAIEKAKEIEKQQQDEFAIGFGQWLIKKEHEYTNKIIAMEFVFNVTGQEKKL